MSFSGFPHGYFDVSRHLAAVQIRRWTGQRPDETESPKDALTAAKKGFAFYQVPSFVHRNPGSDPGADMPRKIRALISCQEMKSRPFTPRQRNVV